MADCALGSDKRIGACTLTRWNKAAEDFLVIADDSKPHTQQAQSVGIFKNIDKGAPQPHRPNHIAPATDRPACHNAQHLSVTRRVIMGTHATIAKLSAGWKLRRVF